MNTINSVYYGWGFLILCGGGSYYFAKRSINADRAARQAMDNDRRLRQNRQMAAAAQATPSASASASASASGSLKAAVGSKTNQSRHRDPPPEHGTGGTSSPGIEAHAGDPSPTGHVGAASGTGKGRFESTQPFRSPKGDRFSSFGKD